MNDILLQVWKKYEDDILHPKWKKLLVLARTRKWERMSMTHCIFQYKHVKRADRADQHLGYYSTLMKTVKWPNKLLLYLRKCTLFNAVLIKYWISIIFILQKFLHETAREWMMENEKDRSVSKDQLADHQPIPSGPKKDPPWRVSRDLSKHKLEWTGAGGEGKKKYPSERCKVCAAGRKTGTTNTCKLLSSTSKQVVFWEVSLWKTLLDITWQHSAPRKSLYTYK